MAAEEELARIDRELDDARRDLRDTLERVNEKVELAEAEFRPVTIVRHHTFAVSCVAAALGFLAGGGLRTLRIEWLGLGALLGSAIMASRKPSIEDGDGADG
jgi:hypothetical protein